MNYLIKNAFTLQSANQKLLLPGSYFNTETPEQEAEMQAFAVDGSCSPVQTEAPKTVDPNADQTDAPLDPTDDLSVVPGVGQKTEKKLQDAGIKTMSQLKEAMLGVERTDDMKAILGMNYDRVLAYFRA